jgi:hypothetical protein
MTALRPYDLRHAAIIATVSAIGILLPKSRAPPRPGTCSAEREGFEPPGHLRDRLLSRSLQPPALPHAALVNAGFRSPECSPLPPRSGAFWHGCGTRGLTGPEAVGRQRHHLRIPRCAVLLGPRLARAALHRRRHPTCRSARARLP